MFRNLLTRAFAIGAALLPLAAFADEQSYQIPWTDVAASDCSIVTRPLSETAPGAIIELRCKGHLDSVVAVIIDGGGK